MGSAMEGSIVLPLAADDIAVLQTEDDSAAVPSQGPFGRTLRVALAMKGGVSLAVWIGGAVAELDVLRRVRVTAAGSQPRAILRSAWADGQDVLVQQEDVIRRAASYAQLLISRGYDAVEFDVLAGASAGGLNAVMFGVAQRIGAATDDILELWQSSGDAWRLMRPGGWRSIDAVLQGDDYFWPQMEHALQSLHEAPRNRASAAPVSIDLSATVIDAESSSERGTREGKAHFHFSGGVRQQDLPGRMIPGAGIETAARDEALRRLAYAARTTSSFPGAFEPARIYSGTVPAHPDAVEMREAFHAHRTPRRSSRDDVLPQARVLDPFRVVDGGVTDNVPIDRAMRAIGTRRSDRYVDRALIYLDPSPKLELTLLARPAHYHGLPPGMPAGAASNRHDRRSAFLAVVLTAVGRMVGRESKDDEVDDVERHRRLLSLEQGKDQLFAPFTEAPIVRAGGTPVHVAQAYARFRARADLDLLAGALTEPSVWQLATTEPRADHHGWSREELRVLEDELRAALGAVAGASLEGVCTGAQARVDACGCLIAWIRALEEAAFVGSVDGGAVAGPSGLGQLWPGTSTDDHRRRLRIRLHLLQQVAVDARDAAIAAVLAAADGCAAEAVPPGPVALAERIVEAWLAHGNAAAGAGDDSWGVLDEIVRELRAVSVAVDAAEVAVGSAPHTTAWSRSPWSGIGRSPASFTARDLAPLVAARGMPTGMPTIRYEDITAGDSLNALAYPALLHAQLVAGYRSLLLMRSADLAELAIDPEDVQPSAIVTALMPLDALRPRTKLAGIGLANFGGFLSARWRTNDWWWGRIDAARGVVDFLETTPALEPAMASTAAADAVAGVVEDAVVDGWRASVAAEAPSRAAFRTEVGGELGGLAALGPSYRVAVASRLLRLLSRALVRGTGPFSIVRVLQWVLRPLLVLVPAVLDPPRAAVAAALAVAPALLLLPATATVGTWAWGTAWVASGLALLGMGIVMVRRWVRGRAVRRALDSARADRVAGAVRRAAIDGIVGAALASLLLAAAMVHACWTGGQGVLTWVLIAAGVVLSLVASARFLIPREPSGQRIVRAAVGYAGAAVIVGVGFGLAPLRAIDLAPPTAAWSTALACAAIAAVTGTVVAIALTVGWLGGFAEQSAVGRHRSGLLALAATAAASGVAAGLPFLLLSTGDWATLTGCALAAAWLWGTALWWVPAGFQPSYTPSDQPSRRPVSGGV